ARLETSTALPSPGMLGRHYAPRTPMECLSESQERVRELLDQGEKVGWVTFDPRTAGSVTFDRRGVTGTLDLLMPRNPAGYAAHLYEVLHRLDGLGVSRIVVEMPPETAEWLAVRDRLTRAAQQS